MPYFVQLEPPIVTWRKHEYNAEYLDGRLDLLSDDVECYIIKHVPNIKFGYNILIDEKVNCSRGWEIIEEKTLSKPDNPRVYYELVPIDKFEEYKKLPKFTFKDTPVSHDETKTKRRQNITVPEKERFDLPDKVAQDNNETTIVEEKPQPVQVDRPKIKKEAKKRPSREFTERPLNLVRDSEKAVYSYQTPSQRNS